MTDTFNTVYQITCIETGKKMQWTVAEILEAINADHSDEFTPYTLVDWREGWQEWETDTKELGEKISDGKTLSETERRLTEAFKAAMATRGKNKGYLKSKCPPIGTDAGMMWQALMLYANPYKSGLGHLIMGGFNDPDFKTDCDKFAANMAGELPALDRDRKALSRLGAW